MKNPIFFCILVALTIVNAVDAITAFFILDGEANPLYLLTGSMWPVILSKLFVLGLLWFYWYRNIYASNFIYYLMILFSVIVTLMVGLAAYGNIQGMLHPELVEAVKDIPKAEKIQAYKTFMIWMYIVPMSFCIFSFWLYDRSLKRVVIDKKYFKKWWKI